MFECLNKQNCVSDTSSYAVLVAVRQSYCVVFFHLQILFLLFVSPPIYLKLPNLMFFTIIFSLKLSVKVLRSFNSRVIVLTGCVSPKQERKINFQDVGQLSEVKEKLNSLNLLRNQAALSIWVWKSMAGFFRTLL